MLIQEETSVKPSLDVESEVKEPEILCKKERRKEVREFRAFCKHLDTLIELRKNYNE